MLGLSLTKILFTVAVIVGVWKIYRVIEARNKHRVDATQKENLNSARPAVEELGECSICGTYVPIHGDAACDRPDCPHGA